MGRHSKEVRSYNMSRIRSTNTKPEEMVRKFLFSKGFRYRKNVKKLPGCPDIVLSKYRTVIFVNGCFWHMHEGCSKFVLPKSNTDYWLPKLMHNKQRDIQNIQLLESKGWSVITVWECELNKTLREKRLDKLYIEITLGKHL
jgi:DNA mismatch endonuclease (patch repair protein)